MCVNFSLYPLLQTFFPLRKTEENTEQVEEYFCQLRWSWVFRSLHALLKQMQFWQDSIFSCSFFVSLSFSRQKVSMLLYHNDLKLHLHYFCTPLSTSGMCFLFDFIFTVKQCNFCVHKTWFIEYRTVFLERGFKDSVTIWGSLIFPRLYLPVRRELSEELPDSKAPFWSPVLVFGWYLPSTMCSIPSANSPRIPVASASISTGTECYTINNVGCREA